MVSGWDCSQRNCHPFNSSRPSPILLSTSKKFSSSTSILNGCAIETLQGKDLFTELKFRLYERKINERSSPRISCWNFYATTHHIALMQLEQEEKNIIAPEVWINVYITNLPNPPHPQP